MYNYIVADIKRICHKKSFLITVGAYIGLFLLMMFIYSNPTFTENAYVAKTTSFLGYFPLVIGLIVFLSVYYDDFKSKSMQVAIGYGMRRYKVVLSKIIESIVLLVLSIVIIGIITMIVPMLLDLKLNGSQITEILFTLVIEMLRAIGYISISSIPVFYTQNAVNGTILYVLLSSKTIMLLLSIILGQDFVVNIFGNLTKFVYTFGLYGIRSTFMQTGIINISIFLMIIIYVILPTIISICGFRKKELEF